MKISRILSISACVAALSLLSCGGGDEEAEPAPEVIRPVVVREIEETSRQGVRTFAGAARADVETPVSFRVPGEIVELSVRVGMRMEKGDRIARLDPTDYRIRMREAEAGLARARAGLGRAESEYERAGLLYETGNISRAGLDNARAAFQSARAETAAAEERLGQARQQLAYTVLEAPLTGVAAEVPVERHQSVAAGTPVALIADHGARRFEIGVPEALIHQVREDAVAEIRFEALSGERFPARVTEVGILSRQLSVFPATLRFDEVDPRILPGMIGEAELAFSRDDAFPTVPPEAVAMDPAVGRFVWVVDPEREIAERRRVEIGPLTEAGLVVREGLAPGDLVVVRGVHRIAEGRRVRPIREDEIR